MNDVFLQQTFDLSIRNKKIFDNFSGHSNIKQKEMFVHYLSTRTENMILLFGESGSGKSHLLQAACHFYQHHGGKATYASLKRPTDIETILLRNLNGLLICIDDVELAQGHLELEHLLFKLYNQVELAGCLMVWGKQSNIPFSRKDLQSRSQAMLKIQLLTYPPAETLMLLEQYLIETQSSIPLPICEYLIKNYTRNMTKLLIKIKEIEEHAYSLRKKITLKMCKELIEDLHLLDEST
jgi:DnaA family protein